MTMTKSLSAAASKNSKTVIKKAKVIATASKHNIEKEKKGNNDELNRKEDMPVYRGRGAEPGRGESPKETTQKRKDNQGKDDFDKKHEKNLAKVYAVWDQKKDLVKPTKYWKGLLKADKDVVAPYTMDDLMGEGEDTIHNRCRIADKKKTIKTGEFHSVEFWMVLFNDVFDPKATSYNEPIAPKLRHFAMRLCKTEPKQIFDEYAWDGNTIKSRQDTIAWVAARKFLGDVWNTKGFDIAKEAADMDIDDDDEPMIKEKNKTTEPPKMVTPAKAVNWEIVKSKQKDKEKRNQENETNKQKEMGSKPVVNKFFLSKGIRKNNYDSNLGNSAHTRKHKVYIKTKLPKVTNKDDA